VIQKGKTGTTTSRGGHAGGSTRGPLKKFMEKEESNFDMTNRDAIY
jgi:hypothetical protein